MPRKATKERNPLRGATQAADYQIGDEVFFSFAGAAGEALFVGQSKDDPSALVLALPGGQVIEMPASACSPTGHIDPQLGHGYRREYMKRFPRKMKG